MIHRLIALLAATLPFSTHASADPGKTPEIRWIWSNSAPNDTERAFFRREFPVPDDVVTASVTVSCDNWQRVWFNGHDLGFSGEWAVPSAYDLTPHLRPGGVNVLAVEGRNQGGVAALAVSFNATRKDGSAIHLVSDAGWQVGTESADGWRDAGFRDPSWKPAVVVGRMGDEPWGEVIIPESGQSGPKDLTADYQLLPGFKLERLYRVPKTQGSWVAMTRDGKGRLLCADQYGVIYLVTPPTEPDGNTEVKPTGIPLRGAHGLLWHRDVLYVTVNEGEDQSGVWQVTDSDGDGEPDKPKLIKAMQGRGEHGPHSLVPSPDGSWIYFVAGNHTDVPEFDSSLIPENWAEDHLLPRRPDAKGHARDRMAPGGWIARFKPDGTDWQLFSIGFRNVYDIAFNDQGDLFAYDADMEYDFGMPWYRPTRINHVVPGSEFGWRNGTGKWPVYYEDSMPTQIDIGPGSPTGFLSGAGARFPQRYQKALFALDWTYATIHAIHLTPSGEGYTAEREEFLAGTGLPLTDAIIGKDGSMYFLTGGRRTGSALWRVSYTGSEDVTPIPPAKAKPLEHVDTAGAWEGMGSPDRITRYRSRLSVETVGPSAITQRLSRETDPWKTIGGAMALARTGTASQRSNVFAALDRLDWKSLDTQQRINWLRACGLAMIRLGEPTADERERILAKIDPEFPSNDPMVNRELCRVLSHLQAPGIVGRTLALMEVASPTPAPDWLNLAKRNTGYGSAVVEMIANLPPEQVIHYIYCLRVVKGPWTADERQRFFAWFDRLLEKSGGESYAGFITDLRNQTMENATPAEREQIGKFGPSTVLQSLADLPPVVGPGREWTVNQVEQLAADGLKGRDLENGRRMYKATLCAACHRFGAEGGSAGPDLSAVAGRFTIRDLAEAIIDPSKVVSDQFAFDLITRRDGSQLIGKMIEEKDEHWIVATSPFDFSQTMEIERNDIKDVKPSPISPMPAGLINRLNPEELKDLLAYMLGQ